MWSLFKKKESEEGIGDGLFDYSGESLDPLKFSNGKSQEDVVKEILDSINEGNRIIFVRGVCGSGKSAVALNLARHFKKTSIVVPIKSLQEQYEKDYTHDNFILRKDKKKLKISVIKGRNNFECKFMNERADNEFLPCTIELREKNMDQIKEFIEHNDFVSKLDFSSVDEVRRMSVAPACPYWSPILPEEVSPKALEGAKKKKYKTISGKDYALFKMKRGCGYYDQYDAYVNSDVLIFNSQKYLIEVMMGRKPKTDLDIIDECDEFLDSFANEKNVNLGRLLSSMNNLFPDTQEKKTALKEIIYEVNNLLQGKTGEGIEKLGKADFYELFKKVLANPYLAEEEEHSYYNSVFEIVKSFEGLEDETYITCEKAESNGQATLFEKNADNVFVNIVSINLAQRFKEIRDNGEVLVLMSGTLHSEQVLRDIFGLTDFKVVEAEVNMPGTILKYRTGLEKNCKYANFSSGIVTRKDYLKALACSVSNAKPPLLVHVSSFGDLPSRQEKEEFEIENIPSRDELKDLQFNDRNGNEVKKFKNGEIDTLFTTKCSRGVDFPGEVCNSILLTKYPYPNISGLFWQILKAEKPDKFMEFYLDKARRDMLQRIARGVRFKGDHVLVLSPDSRVLDARLS
jgi:Rad3-related DNA helicase